MIKHQPENLKPLLKDILAEWKKGDNEDLLDKLMDSISKHAGADDGAIFSHMYDVVQDHFGDKELAWLANTEFLSPNERAIARAEELLGVMVPPKSLLESLKELLGMMPHEVKIESLLDVGCADGSITAALAERLNIRKEFAHGIDIADPDEKYALGSKMVNDRISFQKYDGEGRFKLADGSINLVVAIMSLHHVEKIYELVSEIHRVLSPGGLLVIREHDCTTNDMAVMLDVVHGLYAMVWRDRNKRPVKPTFIKDDKYYSAFRSCEDWEKFITDGQRFTSMRKTHPLGRQKQYAHCFRKT